LGHNCFCTLGGHEGRKIWLHERLTVAHIRSAATIHIGRFGLVSSQTKVSKLYYDATLLATVSGIYATVCDDKVFRLDITVEDVYAMTACDSIAHLGKHGSDETKTVRREKLWWVEGGEEGWGRGSNGRTGRCGGVCLFIGVIASLLQKVEEVLTGNALEDQEQEGVSFECAMEGYYVGMDRNGLMNGGLEKLCL
jgi:hypothetical protein